MAQFNSHDDEIIAGINVTPLVDIMLVLLIIFMLVSSFVVKEAIEVELPHAATGSESKAESLAIAISKEGDYFLSGKKMESFSGLEQELKLKQQANPEIQVVISADKKVYHEQVIKVVDAVRKLNIYKFAINVESMEEKG